LGLPEPTESYNGIDIALTARWGKGAMVTGGLTLGREGFDICYANGQPQLTPLGVHGTYLFSGSLTQFPSYPQSTTNGTTYCHIDSPWWNAIGSQAKMQVIYPLPLDFAVSGNFKTLPGIAREATQYTFDPRAGTLPFGFLPASILPIGNPGNIG